MRWSGHTQTLKCSTMSVSGGCLSCVMIMHLLHNLPGPDLAFEFRYHLRFVVWDLKRLIVSGCVFSGEARLWPKKHIPADSWGLGHLSDMIHLCSHVFTCVQLNVSVDDTYGQIQTNNQTVSRAAMSLVVSVTFQFHNLRTIRSTKYDTNVCLDSVTFLGQFHLESSNTQVVNGHIVC